MITELEIIARIRKIIRAVDIFSANLKNKHGLNSSQLTCLDYINRYGSKPISELSKFINLSPSMMTNIVDQLEKKALVKRVRSDKDRRVIRIELTENASALLEQTPTFLHKKLQTNLDKLSADEKQNIIKSLDQLIESIEAEDIESSPFLASGEKIFGEQEVTIDKDGQFKSKPS